MLRRLEGRGFAVEPVEPGASTSRPGAWSGLPAGSGRHSGARSTPWGRGGACGRSLPSLRGARRGDRGAGRSRPHHRRRRDAPLPRAAPARRPSARRSGGRSFRSSASSAWGSWHASPGPRSPIGSVRTARKHGGSLGEGDTSVAPRRPPAELVETLAFPEPVANEPTLARALAALIERLLARPERAGRAPRQLAISAKLVGEAPGGARSRCASRRRSPTASARASTQAVGAAGSDGGAPPRAGRAHRVGRDADRARPSPREPPARAPARRDAQVRAAVGMDAVCTVVEVAPWSRIPESRAILVPRDD